MRGGESDFPIDSNSNCGTKKETLSLSERVFECSHCGLVIDRDLNAAINLSKTVS
ncbi:zinc ribbon domain-containing protein [Microcoleus sp. AT3-A2]|uniref:zinc ribbon domain-containing protein n=1 Tax=Microcoleus sp. AT3-A2 TaxID=2818610 RepID=UPI002FD37A19